MKITHIVICCLVVATLAGCSSIYGDLDDPTPIPGNTAWNPVARTFDGVEMVLVPPGCFTMGHWEGRRDEQPEHEICFDEAFWIDRYEVTNGQYGSDGAFPGEFRPRDNLTWFEARDFCASRGGRLPTEAEWEYAARGPDSLIYPWGDTFVADNLIYDGNFEFQLHDVGSRPEGVAWVSAYDMAGNASEWVSSLYRPYPYDPDDGREDLNNTTDRRVLRGSMGSYIDYGTSMATRMWALPDERAWYRGFRCARDNNN
jgi:sulfatase modifying factor 1